MKEHKDKMLQLVKAHLADKTNYEKVYNSSTRLGGIEFAIFIKDDKNVKLNKISHCFEMSTRSDFNTNTHVITTKLLGIFKKDYYSSDIAKRHGIRESQIKENAVHPSMMLSFGDIPQLKVEVFCDSEIKKGESKMIRVHPLSTMKVHSRMNVITFRYYPVISHGSISAEISWEEYRELFEIQKTNRKKFNIEKDLNKLNERIDFYQNRQSNGQETNS